MTLRMNSQVVTTVLAFVLILPVAAVNAGYCDGRINNQKIITKPSSPLYVTEGKDAFLNWSYCKAKQNVITGIIIYLQSSMNPRIKTYLLSIDDEGKVYKGSNHNFGTRIDLWKKNTDITFVIKSVILGDSGSYSLEIRREGYNDLRNKVQIFVKKPISVTLTGISNPVLPLMITSTRSRFKPVMSMSSSSSDQTAMNKTDHAEYVNAELTHSYGKESNQSNKGVIRKISTTMRYSQQRTKTREEPIDEKSSQNRRHEVKEHGTIFIALISLAAGLAPFVIFFILYSIVKLSRHQRKKRDRRKSVQSTSLTPQSPETTSSNVRRHFEFDNSLGPSSASTMSGFSFRDSITEYDDSGCPSMITFGISSDMNRPTQVIPKYRQAMTCVVHQDEGCPLVPKRKVYEIKRELIQNLEIVGHGAFGLVAKAELAQEGSRSDKSTVAVKMLKEYASNDDRKDLISEFEIMRHIEPHPNVVKLLGCVMISEPIWVITEFAAGGDLLGFLRKSRGINDTTYTSSLKVNPRTNLSQTQLLQMARDIACGMAHLSSNKIIHRDLAARNILVDANTKCKITDFGMARDVKTTNYYKIKSRGRIPLKWTAIEAILDEKYTTKSDVWSYGIVLYEIVTIGGSPYSGFGPREIVKRLKRGWRMEKPGHVNDELYMIMRTCWHFHPGDRPTFYELSRKFGKLLDNTSEYINMKEYKDYLYGRIDFSSGSSSDLANEVMV